MDEKVTQKSNIIFFLNLVDELPEAYYLLASRLAGLNISLIPVDLTTYTDFAKKEQINLIVYLNDLKKLASYKLIRERFLDFSLKNGRTQLFEISSFGPSEIANQVRYQNNYTHICLPEHIGQISLTIARKYYKSKKSLSIWPGGRRAKLPSML